MFSLTQGILGTTPSEDSADHDKPQEDTTGGLWGTASAALGSWGGALVAPSDPDAEEELCQNLEESIQQAEQAALGAVTSMFGALSSAAGGATSAITEAAQGAVFELDRLQQQELQKDAHKARILESLDRYLDQYPTTGQATYEEWLEYYLANYESAWDAEQGKIDETYYTEDSVHRNLWNERIYHDSDGGEAPNRAYVKAKGNRKEKEYEEIVFETDAAPDDNNNDTGEQDKTEDDKKEESETAKSESNATEDPKTGADGNNDETKDNAASAEATATGDKKDDVPEKDGVLVEKEPEAEAPPAAAPVPEPAPAPAPVPVPAPAPAPVAPKKKPAAAADDDLDDDLADLLG